MLEKHNKLPLMPAKQAHEWATIRQRCVPPRKRQRQAYEAKAGSGVPAPAAQ